MELTLAQHLANLNAEKLAWVAEDPDNRWTGLWVEDLEHWNSMGIYTVEDFKRYDLIQLIWDMYKEVTGIRPRHIDFDSMSMADLEQEANYLSKRMEEEILADAEYERQEMLWAMEDAEIENAQRDEMPLPIDYVAANYQDGWL